MTGILQMLLAGYGAVKDAYFNYVTLLLPGNGTNGAQNNTFLDSSTNNFTITRNGNTTQGTFSPYGSNWSNYFDGASYISVPDNAAFTMGSGDFSIECWYFPTSSARQILVAQSNSAGQTTSISFLLEKNASDQLRVVVASGSTAYVAVSTSTIALNTWSFVQMIRSGNTLYGYVNGVQFCSVSVTGVSINDSAEIVSIGGNYISLPVYGYLSNVRIVKGTAVSAGVPTSPLTAISGTSLLTCQSNRFIDNSSNAFAITVNGTPSVQRFSPFSPTAPYAAGTEGGSGYFDGSGDYLDGSSSTGATNFGTSDFTVECWVYFNSVAAQSNFIDNIGNSTNSLYTAAGGSLRYFANSSNVITGATLVAGQWYHIALVRSSGTTKLYVNGTQSGSNYTDSTNYAGGSTYPRIGAAFNATTYHNGYIADVRCVKSAVYTATFTPPSAPLTAIANTSLLLSCTNAGIFDTATMNDLETVGNAQISTAQSKFGGGSMYFDGNGDYLQGPSTPQFDFGAGDFTIEMWAYPTAVGQSNLTLLYAKPNGSGYSGIIVGQAVSGYGAVIYASSTGSSWNLASGVSIGTMTANAWNHIAVTRSGTNLYGFLNGVLGSTTSVSTTALVSTTGNISIGSSLGTASTYFTGYIDDLRITKGYARYTANFTAPTAPFPLQ